ncbi:TPA: beta-lactamase family protein [Stenotrophomonas maltophilia]|nr:beta-lactamase family protein [Stenotrophomonas maltophilia]
MIDGSRMQSLLERIAPEQVPGIWVAVGRHGRMLWEGAAGWSDIQQRHPAAPGLALGIGSITKTWIAVLVLQLAEEGRLCLHDSIAQHLPAQCLDGIANAARASIADLLDHHSGIFSWEDAPDWIRRGRGIDIAPGRPWSADEPLQYVRGRAAAAPVGEAFHYSNSNFTLLGLLIEQVSGRSLVEVLQQRILQPLELTATCLEGFGPSVHQLRAKRYHWRTAEYLASAGLCPQFPVIDSDRIDVSSSDLSVEWAAGGLVCPTHELLRFMMALADGRLLSAAGMQAMQRWRAAGERGETGRGLFRMTTPEGNVLGHDGNVLGSSASAWWFEQAACTVAIQVNIGSMHAGPAACSAGRLFRSRGIARLALQMCSAG